MGHFGYLLRGSRQGLSLYKFVSEPVSEPELRLVDSTVSFAVPSSFAVPDHFRFDAPRSLSAIR